MDSHSYLALEQELRKLRRPIGNAGKAGVRPAIELLLKMLENEQSPDERISIVNVLAHEYAYEFDAVGEEWAIRECLRLQPDHPYPYGSLAMFLWLSRDDMTEAIGVARKAVELSHQTGILPIHSLGVQARVARKAKDWELFASSLSNLIAGFGYGGARDIGYERDFMRKLPRSAPDWALYKEYNQFVVRREALRGERQIHHDLQDLQTLEWAAADDADHIATQGELLLLDRCRRLFETELAAANARNWREILGELAGQSRLRVSSIDRILESFQIEAATIGKPAARARAYEAVETLESEDIRHWANQAIVFVNRVQGSCIGA